MRVLRWIAVLCVGCTQAGPAPDRERERDSPAPEPVVSVEPASPALEASWQGLQAVVDDDEKTVHEKLAAVEAFVAANPSGHPYVEPMLEQQASLRRAVEEDFAVQTARAEAYKAKHAAEEEAREAAAAEAKKAIAAGSIETIAAEVLFRLAPWADDGGKGSTFAPVKMSLPSSGSRTRYRPFHPSDMTNLRWAASEVASLYLADDLKALAGKILRGSGKLDPAALRTALDKAWVDPDDPFLGTTAREVYTLFADAVEAYRAVHRILTADIGRAATMKAFRSGLQKQRRGGESMVAFYAQWSAEHDVASKVGGTSDVEYIVGFWMRRMDDGTDKILAAYLDRIAEAYGET